MTALIPTLPDSAPFTVEQRAWLNGYLAGLFAWSKGSPQEQIEPAEPITILFASQTGGAEKAAKQLAKSAKQKGYAVTIKDMGDTKPADLVSIKRLCIIASTYGDGEPPDRAKPFWKDLANGAPRLENTHYSVLALGDSNYPKFCEFGRTLDQRLAELGAQRLAQCQECDGDWVEGFKTWSQAVLGASTASAESETEVEKETHASFVKNRKLSAEASAKDVRHFEFDLAGTGLSYAAGDALSVWPKNDPVLVEAILNAAGLSGEEKIAFKGKEATSHEALMGLCEINRISLPLFKYVKQVAQPSELAAITSDAEIRAWCDGRDVLDLLRLRGEIALDPAGWITSLKDLKPRLYSISSSPVAHGSCVHLTVSAVRYESQGRARFGVCSTFLADRLVLESPVRVTVHENNAFRPPSPETALIMIGPGTGIAPFRGFLHERKALGATGKNWLFFGDQKESTDYLYRDEIETFVVDGLLTRLDLAWSRDGAEKVYVQHLMLRKSAKFWQWLEEGAAVYVCGDASRMAKDVEAAILSIIRKEGHLSPEAAEAYLNQLKAERRYQRDVY